MRLSTLLAPLLLAAPAAAQLPDPQVRLDRLLAGRAAGPPQACLPNRPNLRTEVIPGEALVYRQGGRLWINRPDAGREWLTEASILAQATPISSFCRGDGVQIIDRVGGFQRGFLILGEFTPYARAPRP